MKRIEVGNYLDNNLTELLSKNTTLKDAANIGAETNISSSLILKVKNGTSRVTEMNKKAIDKLLVIAYQNIEANEKEAKKNKRTLKTILDCI
ncbi:hypothetical protein EG359_17245 [Chryseobacterium joostei]|uniref:XRE family transcriptional regulator n=1 Tax=Chryseobacterium joostei TaxID=112234 RepID=A0A1N7IAV9_9FLAO|nr:hypothetical protein [Chryseobacterium joostei]AZB01250.1 hypothetical protein EG359_17245 [Chryseobacterium joostei]SIS34205.1 hypothetical protein SAMN05421768_103646 [Chryseobacterium joostei]